MNIKEKMLTLINSDKINFSYMAVEKLIMVMMKDYLESKDKSVSLEYKVNNVEYDMVLPDGIEDGDGCIAVEIKMFRQMNIRIIRRLFERFTNNRGEIDKFLLIIVNEVPENIRKRIIREKQRFDFDLTIWDINNLVKIFSNNEELFDETYNNLNSLLLRDAINSVIRGENDDYLKEKERLIKQLQKEYENDNIVLFLGAGVSCEANIPTWNALISELFVALIDKQLRNNKIEIEQSDKEKLVNELIKHSGNSPLMQTRLLRAACESDFATLVRGILYKSEIKISKLLTEIGQLCVPNRGKFGIKAIVNYNFDDLVEKILKQLRVKYHSIYSEGIVPEKEELGVYHVHGFLPQEDDIGGKSFESLLVFSEEGYHRLFLDSYNWANLSQLNFMINNTCLFIGLSMTDPNLRRLLDIAAKKRTDVEECRHYVVMRRALIKELAEIKYIDNFQRVNETLQENVYRELGVNILWIDDYEEIPNLLKKIKEIDNNCNYENMG